MTEEASIAEARADLSRYINRVAHGKERIVLTSRGKPKAALVSLEDLQLIDEREARRAGIMAAMADADDLVARIRKRRGGVPMRDSAEVLEEVREARLAELMNPGAE